MKKIKVKKLKLEEDKYISLNGNQIKEMRKILGGGSSTERACGVRCGNSYAFT